MKVAIDTSPLKTGHRLRGVGFYTKSLIENLPKIDRNNEYIFFDDGTVPSCNLVHYPYFDLYFNTLSSKQKIPFVVTIHDLIPLVFPELFPVGIRGKFNFWRQKKALKFASRIICDSQCSKIDVIKYLNFDPNLVDVVYLAPSDDYKVLEKEDCLDIKQKYDLPDDFILYVGDVNYNKNLVNLILAMNKIDSTLIMVGSALVDNSLNEVRELVSQMRKSGVSRKIRRLGFVENEDLVKIYNLATCYIQPSLYEGFGLPVVEAMACGTPVVISKNSSLEEVAKDVGFFVNAQDYDSIAKGVNKVLDLKINNSKNFDLLRKKSIEQSAKFTWEKTVKMIINSYIKALNV